MLGWEEVERKRPLHSRLQLFFRLKQSRHSNPDSVAAETSHSSLLSTFSGQPFYHKSLMITLASRWCGAICAALEPQKMKSVKDWIAESVFEYLTMILLSDSHEGLTASLWVIEIFERLASCVVGCKRLQLLPFLNKNMMLSRKTLKCQNHFDWRFHQQTLCLTMFHPSDTLLERNRINFK